MLFNSYSFLFIFLPVVVAGYFALGRLNAVAGAFWLALASLFFYAWWDWRYLWLLLGSILLNFAAGTTLTRHANTQVGKRALAAAVTANLLLLAYYKYADFFVGSVNAVLGTQWPLLGVLLPIGISFFTFTQIAFLVDAYVGKVKETHLVNYLLFVTYFPHLVAGPVLHHKEMMPQFALRENYRPQSAHLAVGLTIFSIGLAKKVLIADSLAPLAAPVFMPSTADVHFLSAWGGALAYTFQLYFDFSGYSDMAIGLSRLFGVKLPLNFHSPYKASSISEFWRRWHMTLSRFLRDYLYVPLGGNRCGALRQKINLMTTMVLGGLWHGAGWTFVVWGTLHGLLLVVNHAWSNSGIQKSLGRYVPAVLGRASAWALTFMAVVFAWVYFRAPDLSVANRVVWAMLGQSGIAVPENILLRLGGAGQWLMAHGVSAQLGGGGLFVETWVWIAVASILALSAPNTQQIMARYEPALAEAHMRPVEQGLVWRPVSRWAIAVGVLLGLSVLSLSNPSEFLYFQF